jgi:hypothetical protein
MSVPIERQKKVIIERMIGEAPIENFDPQRRRYAERKMRSHPTSHAMSAPVDAIAIERKSDFGGQSTSSADTGSLGIFSSLWMFSVIENIIYDNEGESHGDKYIRKVQNCKIFHCDKVYDPPFGYTLVCM